MLERVETAAVAGDRLPSRFWWGVSHDRAGAVVALHGAFDQAAAERLAPVLRDLIDEHLPQALVVDLRDVGATDPEALKLFPTVAAWGRQRGTRFRPVLPDEGLEVHTSPSGPSGPEHRPDPSARACL